jgi:hypothetical protein
MPKDPEEIVEIWEQRQRYYGKSLNRMRETQRLMDNEMEVPLPELSVEERSLVANLALRGMENLSQRIASTEPSMYWPSTHAGYDKPDADAKNRHRVMSGWHESNNLYMVRAKRAQHFLSWATSPVVIKPDPLSRVPKWDVKRPLESFVPPGAYDDLLPHDIITCDVYSYQDLLQLFDRDIISQVTKPPGWNWENDVRNYSIEFEVLEYIDEHEISLILVGHHMDQQSFHRGHNHNLRSSARLSYAPNLVGRPLVVQPGRICLNEQLGHYDGIIGMYQAQAAFMSLLVIAQRRAVWPREWAESHPNSQADPEIVQDPDPYRGIPGVIANGRLTQQNLDPSFRTLEIMDRQESAMRQDAGIPQDMGGATRTHISARRGAQVMSATVDFTVAQAQNLFAKSQKEEDKLAAEVDTAYFNKKKTFFIETRAYIGSVTYTPEDLWKDARGNWTHAHIVEYPIAGTDIQNLPIEGGQRVQMETLSREGFMEMDPAIKDVPAELQRMDQEALKRAFLAMIQSLVSTPPEQGMRALEPRDIAELSKAVGSGEDLLDAYIKLDDAIKQRQAEAQAAMAEQQGQLPPGAESMPGTATSPTGEGQPPIPEAQPSLARFTQLLGSLGTSQQAGRFRGPTPG